MLNSEIDMIEEQNKNIEKEITANYNYSIRLIRNE
jgi:hypothetical protein